MVSSDTDNFRTVVHWVLASAVSWLLIGCVSTPFEPVVYVNEQHSNSIESVRISILEPSTNVSFREYSRNKNEAFKEGASQAASGCNGLECLLAPLVAPISGSATSAASDSAENILKDEEAIKSALARLSLGEGTETTLKQSISVQSPYFIVEAGESAILCVNVRPIDISGQNLSLQKVRPALIYDVIFNVYSADGTSSQLINRSYAQFSDAQKLKELASNLEGFVAWLADAQNTLANRIADDLYYAGLGDEPGRENELENTLILRGLIDSPDYQSFACG